MRRLRDLRGIYAGTDRSKDRPLHSRVPAGATPRRQFYRSEMVRDYCGGGACTGLRNTPIPATLTSTTSPATSGPTPAGVPVAITSPGYRGIIRDIQRTRNVQE